MAGVARRPKMCLGELAAVLVEHPAGRLDLEPLPVFVDQRNLRL